LDNIHNSYPILDPDQRQRQDNFPLARAGSEWRHGMIRSHDFPGWKKLLRISAALYFSFKLPGQTERFLLFA
jgi:hypothetical protein